MLKDKEGEHAIMELAFMYLILIRDTYEIRAEEEMEFVINVIEFNQVGLGRISRLAHWTSVFQAAQPMRAICPGLQGTQYRSQNGAVSPNGFGRVLMGTTRADGEGTVEKGHPAVHQWNYCVGNSDFTMSVGYKRSEQHGKCKP